MYSQKHDFVITYRLAAAIYFDILSLLPVFSVRLIEAISVLMRAFEEEERLLSYRLYEGSGVHSSLRNQMCAQAEDYNIILSNHCPSLRVAHTGKVRQGLDRACASYHRWGQPTGTFNLRHFKMADLQNAGTMQPFHSDHNLMHYCRHLANLVADGVRFSGTSGSVTVYTPGNKTTSFTLTS